MQLARSKLVHADLAPILQTNTECHMIKQILTC